MRLRILRWRFFFISEIKKCNKKLFTKLFLSWWSNDVFSTKLRLENIDDSFCGS